MSDLPRAPDTRLKYYQWLAFGAMGLYVYKLAKNQNKSLLGGEDIEMGKMKINVNPDKMVDSVAPWISIPPEQKQMVVTALKEFLKGMKSNG